MPVHAPEMPAGVVLPYAASTAPAGWLLCDGAAVSRTTYKRLFDTIGTTYGAGDGSTTFNLPDLQGRTVVGKGTHTDVDALGKNEGLAAGNRTPSHHHLTPNANGTQTAWDGVRSGNMHNPAQYQKSTGNSNLQDTPAFIVLNHIIRT